MSLKYTTVSAMLVADPRINSAGTINSEALCAYAEWAEAYVEAKLAKSYTLPFSPVPPAIATIATNLALYNVYAKRILIDQSLKDSPWPDRFKEADDFLDKIAAGTYALVTSAGAVVATIQGSAPVWSNTSGYQPTMTELDPTEQFVDTQKINDLRIVRGVLPIPGVPLA